eukprot:UN05443
MSGDEFLMVIYVKLIPKDNLPTVSRFGLLERTNQISLQVGINYALKLRSLMELKNVGATTTMCVSLWQSQSFSGVEDSKKKRGERNCICVNFQNYLYLNGKLREITRVNDGIYLIGRKNNQRTLTEYTGNRF